MGKREESALLVWPHISLTIPSGQGGNKAQTENELVVGWEICEFFVACGSLRKLIRWSSGVARVPRESRMREVLRSPTQARAGYALPIFAHHEALQEVRIQPSSVLSILVKLALNCSSNARAADLHRCYWLSDVYSNLFSEDAVWSMRPAKRWSCRSGQ